MYPRNGTLSSLQPKSPPGLPVERLARQLLAEAEACPALIGRAETAPAVASTRVAESFASMALLSDPALDVRQYLEDLVSIAVNSAQQAEDLAVQAREAGRKARRGMAVVASLGAMGLVVGVAGFAASRSANVRLAEVRGEIGALHEMQRQSQDQLADIAARTSDQRDAVEVTQRSEHRPGRGDVAARASTGTASEAADRAIFRALAGFAPAAAARCRGA